MIFIRVLASGSSGNCYYVSDGKTVILLDAGIPFKKIQERCGFHTSSIAAVLITHRHGDHAKAVPELLRRGIKVFSNHDVCALFPEIKIAKAGVPYGIGTFAFRAFECQHDVECYGYLIESQITGERLLYFTDTAYIKYRFHSINYIMAEANYSFDALANNAKTSKLPYFVSERVLQTHMSIDTLLAFLQANDLRGVKEIYLLHLSNANSDAVDFKRRVEEETGAAVYVF
ncbi:MBL fold metallo-hydrolase [Megasphaera sueciensis]|uniref:MBL fold metallo-hydrolase n=1 Tax=Megasphaera sueciensis TaxID=349094 RepID=UPI003CFBF7BC